MFHCSTNQKPRPTGEPAAHKSFSISSNRESAISVRSRARQTLKGAAAPGQTETMQRRLIVSSSPGGAEVVSQGDKPWEMIATISIKSPGRAEVRHHRPCRGFNKKRKSPPGDSRPRLKTFAPTGAKQRFRAARRWRGELQNSSRITLPRSRTGMGRPAVLAKLVVGSMPSTW